MIMTALPAPGGHRNLVSFIGLVGIRAVSIGEQKSKPKINIVRNVDFACKTMYTGVVISS